MKGRDASRIGVLLLLWPLSGCATAYRADASAEPPPPPPPPGGVYGSIRPHLPGPPVEARPGDVDVSPAPTATGPDPRGGAAAPTIRRNVRHRWVLCPGSTLREGGSGYLVLLVAPARRPDDRRCETRKQVEGSFEAYSLRDAVRSAVHPTDAVTPPEVAHYPDGGTQFEWPIQPASAGGVTFKVSVNVLYAGPDGVLGPRRYALDLLDDVEVLARNAAPKPVAANVVPLPKVDPKAPWWQNLWSIALWLAAGVAAIATFLRNTDGVLGMLRKWGRPTGGHDHDGPPPPAT